MTGKFPAIGLRCKAFYASLINTEVSFLGTPNLWHLCVPSLELMPPFRGGLNNNRENETGTAERGAMCSSACASSTCHTCSRGFSSTLSRRLDRRDGQSVTNVAWGTTCALAETSFSVLQNAPCIVKNKLFWPDAT